MENGQSLALEADVWHLIREDLTADLPQDSRPGRPPDGGIIDHGVRFNHDHGSDPDFHPRQEVTDHPEYGIAPTTGELATKQSAHQPAHRAPPSSRASAAALAAVTPRATKEIPRPASRAASVGSSCKFVIGQAKSAASR